MITVPPRIHFWVESLDRIACYKHGGGMSRVGSFTHTVDPHKVDCKTCRKQPEFLVAVGKVPPPPEKRDAERYRILREKILPFSAPHGPLISTPEEFDAWVDNFKS